MPAGIVNGARTKGAKRQAVINALAFGDSHVSIAQALGISRKVVRAIERAESPTVAQRKERLAVLAEHGAMAAGNKLLEAIEAGDIKGASLVAPYGVFVDKALALRGDTLNINHRHDHIHHIADDDIVAFAVQRSKTVKARVVDATPLLEGNAPIESNQPNGAPPVSKVAAAADRTDVKQGTKRRKKGCSSLATVARERKKSGKGRKKSKSPGPTTEGQ